MPHKANNFFQFNRAKWHYYQYGDGSESLIAMHGFGQNGSMFEPIAPAFGEKYSIYAFDFINHGKTEWNSAAPCTAKMWAEMLDAFAKEKGIKRISLMGFSMGGKILLHSLSLLKTPVDLIFPMAMDGVKLSFYHKPYLKNPLPNFLVKKIIFNFNACYFFYDFVFIFLTYHGVNT
jgi:predicted esterase